MLILLEKIKIVFIMESNSNCTSSQQNTDNAIYQLSARLVSGYLQREGCHKSQQHFHLESPIKSIFTHSCTKCSPPTLHTLLTDYYKLLSMVNNQNSRIPQCDNSMQIVKSSASKKRKPTRLDQLACIPLQYTNGKNKTINEREDFNEKLEYHKMLLDKHDSSIQNLIHLANMQQKTLQSLVLTSIKQTTAIDTETNSPRKKAKLMPEAKSPKKKVKSSGVATKEVERDEYMTQLIDTILNDQSLLDKLVNYINQSLDTPNTEDTIAENVMRLTESDPQFGDILWPS